MQTSKKTGHRVVDIYDFLPPEPAPRRNAGFAPARPIMVEDAVFEVVAPGWTDYPQVNDNPPPRDSRRRIDYPRIVAFAGVYIIHRAEALLSRLSTQVFVTLLGSLFLSAFWLFGGFSGLGATHKVMPLAPLTVQDIRTVEEDANGMKLLVVGGALVNNSSIAIDMPELTVTTQSGKTIGTITPPGSRLAPKATIRFAARFKVDGGKSGTIAVFPIPR